MSNRIRDTYFDGNAKVRVKDIAHCFKNYEGNDDVEAVKLAQLYLLEGVLLSRDLRHQIQSFSIELVDNEEEFNKFPWGRYVYEYTIKSMKNAFEGRGERRSKSNPSVDRSYSLNGFPNALLYWAYECIPSLSNEIVSRIDWKIPRMLNWKARRIPNFLAFQKEIFSADAVSIFFREINFVVLFYSCKCVGI